MRARWHGVAAVALVGCATISGPPPTRAPERSAELAALDPAAEAYVKVLLAASVHDELVIDSYFGPAEWRENAQRARVPLSELAGRVDGILRTIPETSAAADPLVRWRGTFLRAQLGALRARLERLGGRRRPFAEETLALYGVTRASRSDDEFARWHRELEPLLPGPGSLLERAVAQHERYRIRPGKLLPLFEAGAEECRRRTAGRMALPAGERFTIELVSDKFWWAFAQNMGGGRTHIQLNTDAPFELSDAIDYGCHEAYPGHHVQSLLVERLATGAGLVELQVLPTFSPHTFLAEGHANAAIALAFAPEERVAFARDVLFPMAGLDPGDAGRYIRSRIVLWRLYFAAIASLAERLADGKLDEAGGVAWMQAHALCSRKVAEDSVRFARTVGAYVLGYDLGWDLVERELARGGDDPASRWRTFEAIWVPPALPAELAAGASR